MKLTSCEPEKKISPSFCWQRFLMMSRLVLDGKKNTGIPLCYIVAQLMRKRLNTDMGDKKYDNDTLCVKMLSVDKIAMSR